MVNFACDCSFLKIFRIFAYFISISGLIFYMYGNLIFYFEPNIGLTEKIKRSRDIPLPAITICSPLVLRSNLSNLMEFYKATKEERLKRNYSLIDKSYLAIEGELCAPSLMGSMIEELIGNIKFDFLKLLRDGAPSIDESFALCTEIYDSIKCSQILKRILTDLGRCFTFNMQTLRTILNEYAFSSDFGNITYENNLIDEWSLEKGYKSNEINYPYRAIPSKSYSFIMYLNKSDTNDLCYFLKNTYKVIFHLPNEIPTIFHNAEFVQLNTQTLVKLTAVSYSSNEQLKHVPIEKRGCYFEGEKALKFFKSYTKAQCNFECLTNFTLRRCGCVKFNYPRSQNTSVCTLDDNACSFKALIDWPEKDEMSMSFAMPCNCYPPCTDIHYIIKQKQVIEATSNSSLMISKIVKDKK